MPAPAWLRTLTALGSLLCCPPLPWHITAKLTFLPPSPPGYAFESADGAESNDDGDPQPVTLAVIIDGQCIRIRDRVSRFSVVTKDRNRLACIYIPAPAAELTILYCHGNASDIGHMTEYLLDLSLDLNCDIILFDYAGYGLSTGRPFESVIYNDVEAVFKYMVEAMNIDPKTIVVYGQSIGSCAAIDLAGKFEVGAVILHSPLMSGLRVLYNVSRTWLFDPFKNIVKIKKVPAMVMVVHGTADELIPVEQGQALHAAAPNAIPPLWIEGGTHNDLETYPELRERLQEFVAQLKMDQHKNILLLEEQIIEDSALTDINDVVQ